MPLPGPNTLPGSGLLPSTTAAGPPPPLQGRIPTSRAPRPVMGISRARPGSVPIVLIWVPSIGEYIAVDVDVAVQLSPEFSVAVTADLPAPDVSYVADVLGGSVVATATLEIPVDVLIDGPYPIFTPIADVAVDVSVVATMSALTLADDFNRANGALGANWVGYDTGVPIVSTNRAQAGTTGPSNANTIYSARHATPLLSDDVEVSFTTIAPTGTYDGARGTAAIVRAAEGTVAASRNGVVMGVVNNAAYLNTYVGGTVTQQATASSLSIPTGAVIRCRAVNNVYSMYLGEATTPMLTWTDSGNIITRGAGRRYWGIEFVGTKNFSGSSSTGYGMDNVSAKDL